jgi:hypothetical protein
MPLGIGADKARPLPVSCGVGPGRRDHGLGNIDTRGLGRVCERVLDCPGRSPDPAADVENVCRAKCSGKVHDLILDRLEQQRYLETDGTR